MKRDLLRISDRGFKKIFAVDPSLLSLLLLLFAFFLARQRRRRVSVALADAYLFAYIGKKKGFI